MLKSVRLKNFKLHEDTLIEAAPITVFIGPNNSGKSSPLQALLLLRQAATRNDRFLCQPRASAQSDAPEHHSLSPDFVVDLGSFQDVVRKGSSDIEVRLCGDVTGYGQIIEEASADLLMRIRGNELVFSSGSITCFGEEARWGFAEGQPAQPNPVGLTLGGVQYKIQPTNTFRLTQSAGYEPDREMQPEELLHLNRFSHWLGAIPSELLYSVHPVYALRGFEAWGYPLPENKPKDLDLSTIGQRAVALTGMLAYDRDLEESVSQRLTELLSIRIKVRLVESRRATVWVKPSDSRGAETLFVNEGTGASQLPFILIPVALTPRNETILLSEPEAHMHPKAQCDLTRMLLTVARKENIQFFIETHSEHVLHTILNAVAAKGEWKPDEVALHYFQNKNGVAEVSRREINQFGQVDGGLPDFFEQSLAELTDYLKAVSKS